MIGKIEGKENIPKDKNFIIVANHRKLIDPLLMVYPVLRTINKKVHFIASAKWWPYLGDKICRGWAGCIPLFDSKQAYTEAKETILSDEIVGIFPEGYIKLNNRKPRDGAVRLALETKTPILPIMVDSFYIPFKSKVRIGKLLQPSDIKKKYKDPVKLMKLIYDMGLA